MVYTKMKCVEIGPNDWAVCWRFDLREKSGYQDILFFKRDIESIF